MAVWKIERLTAAERDEVFAVGGDLLDSGVGELSCG